MLRDVRSRWALTWALAALGAASLVATPPWSLLLSVPAMVGGMLMLVIIRRHPL